MNLKDVLSPDHVMTYGQGIGGSRPASKVFLGRGDMVSDGDGRKFIAIRGGDYETCIVEPMADDDPRWNYEPPHRRLILGLRAWLRKFL